MKPKTVRLSKALKVWRQALPEEDRAHFDSAPDLESDEWTRGLFRVLWAQYQAVSKRFDEAASPQDLQILGKRMEILVDQMRKVKHLDAIRLQHKGPPAKVTVRPFEDGEAVTPEPHG